jgi:hypothetical protein
MTSVNDHLFNQKPTEIKVAFNGKIATPGQYLKTQELNKELTARLEQVNIELLEARKREVILNERCQRLLVCCAFLAFMVMVEALLLIAMCK